MQRMVEPLLEWYGDNKRRLPWREDKNPYHVWVSEIMLQQTRVEAVKGYYTRFLAKLPDVQELAQVADEELMKLWQGLGYYNRARNLKKAAQVICTEHQGRFPSDYEMILALPGIGEYTAGAIASIAFGQRVPAVDGNVYRIYTRYFADSGDITTGKVRTRIRNEVAEAVPEGEAGTFNQALMDLGAVICLPNGQPLCEKCPIGKWCLAREQEKVLDFPVKTAKKPRKTENKTIFLMEYQDRYLLQQRPDKGLLAGLWEFPSQEGRLLLEEVVKGLADWETDAEHIELLGAGKHIFSHIEWHMLGYLVHLKSLPAELPEGFVLADIEQIQEKYSIPSAFSMYTEEVLRRYRERELAWKQENLTT